MKGYHCPSLVKENHLTMAKLSKEEKQARRLERKKAGKGLWAEFKAFINKGNAFMLAVGVVIGGAFSAIVNAFVNMLTSLATWPVPGGLKGLVTVLPALTDAQKGLPEIGQKFEMSQLQAMTIQFAANSGIDVSNGGGFIETAADGSVKVLDAAGYASMQNALLGKYTLHGTTYTYNMSAIIDWGTLINAIIAFIIIAVVLFIMVKVAAKAAAKREEAAKRALERYYEKHPEERPAEPEPEAPKPTQEELLTSILAELKKQNAK